MNQEVIFFVSLLASQKSVKHKRTQRSMRTLLNRDGINNDTTHNGILCFICAFVIDTFVQLQKKKHFYDWLLQKSELKIFD